MLAINPTALFYTMAAALPLMHAAFWDRVVSNSLVHGTTASPLRSAYVAAKHVVVGLTKTVVLKKAAEAITVNEISPEYTLTPLLEDQLLMTMQKYEMSQQEVIEKSSWRDSPLVRSSPPNYWPALASFYCRL